MQHSGSDNMIVGVVTVLLVATIMTTFVLGTLAYVKYHPLTKVLWVICLGSFMLLGFITSIPASQA